MYEDTFCYIFVCLQSHTCDQIRQNAVCEDSAEVYITFKPWKNLGDVIGDLKIKIHVYKRTSKLKHFHFESYQ
jgi:hypothetical protein